MCNVLLEQQLFSILVFQGAVLLQIFTSSCFSWTSIARGNQFVLLNLYLAPILASCLQMNGNVCLGCWRIAKDSGNLEINIRSLITRSKRMGSLPIN
jgi:hypothetical protein